jgi:hypothetical protein
VTLPADHVKELMGIQYIKQEPFSSLDENENENENDNDNGTSNISGLERKQSLIMEHTCDIEIKSEPPLEESKPVITKLVAVALFTAQEGVTLPAIQVKKLKLVIISLKMIQSICGNFPQSNRLLLQSDRQLIFFQSTRQSLLPQHIKSHCDQWSVRYLYSTCCPAPGDQHRCWPLANQRSHSQLHR